MTKLLFCDQMTAGGGWGQVTIIFSLLIFLLAWFKEACMLNFSFQQSYFTTSPDGRADGRRLEESKIRLTQPSLAGTGAELGNDGSENCPNYLYVLF